jgi:hypothetical protein
MGGKRWIQMLAALASTALAGEQLPGLRRSADYRVWAGDFVVGEEWLTK